jgi:hypothetical protein
MQPPPRSPTAYISPPGEQLAQKGTPELPKTETDKFFIGLRALIRTCEPTVNKHDLVTVAITACIWEGFNTRRRIVGALTHLGFDYRHVCILLNDGTGSDPERHRWHCDDQGVYIAIE